MQMVIHWGRLIFIILIMVAKAGLPLKVGLSVKGNDRRFVVYVSYRHYYQIFLNYFQ